MSSAKFIGYDPKGNKKFQLSLCAGYNANGQQKRKRPTIIAKNLKAAEKEAVLREAALTSKPFVMNTTMTFSEYADYYLRKRKGRVKDSTHSLYKSIINQCMLPFLGNTNLQKIDKATLLEFTNWLKSLPCKRDSDKPLADRSRHMALTYLATMLKFAVSWGFIDFNPYLLLNPDERLRPHYAKRTPYTEKELDILFRAYNKLPPQLAYVQQQLAFAFALQTGARRGEIMALKWKNISLESNSVEIRLSNTIVDGTVRTGTPKTDSSERPLCFSEHEQHLFLLLKHLQDEYLEKKGYCNENDWVFISTRNVPKSKIVNPLMPNAPYNFLKDMLKKNDLDPNNFHALRHTTITEAVSLDIPVKQVGTLAGHTDSKTTDGYTHTSKNTQRKIADRLAAHFASIRTRHK